MKKRIITILGIITILISCILVILTVAYSGESLFYPPNITIIFPVNNTVYTSTSIDLNWSSNETLDWVVYNLDDTSNNSRIYNNCSNTPLKIKDLTNIDGVGLTNKSYGGNDEFLIRLDGSGECSEGKGEYMLDNNAYTDYSEIGNVSVWVALYSGGNTIDVRVGDYIILTYDGSNTKKIYFPEYKSILHKNFYIANDGSTYYDSNLNNLAYGADNCNTPQNITLNLYEGTHNLTIYGNDSNGNMGQSSYVYFTINETPQWDNNQTNITENTQLNYSVQLNITLTDNFNLSSYIFSWNVSGFWWNFSTRYFNVTTTNTTIITNQTINQSLGKSKSWTVYFNDTLGNANQTDIFTFSVKNIPPNITISLIPSPITATEDINITGIYTDSDGDSQIDNETRWYKNGIENASWRNFTRIQNVHSNNFSDGDTLISSMRVYDGFDWSNWINSSQLTIGDSTSPTIQNKTLSKTSYYSDENFNFTVNVTDVLSSIEWVVMTLNKSDIHTNYTINLLIGDVYTSYPTISTLGTGTYNIPYIYAKDSSNNLRVENTNLSFLVTIKPSTTTVVSSGGGGGGGSKARCNISVYDTTGTAFLFTSVRTTNITFTTNQNIKRLEVISSEKDITITPSYSFQKETPLEIRGFVEAQLVYTQPVEINLLRNRNITITEPMETIFRISSPECITVQVPITILPEGEFVNTLWQGTVWKTIVYIWQLIIELFK